MIRLVFAVAVVTASIPSIPRAAPMSVVIEKDPLGTLTVTEPVWRLSLQGDIDETTPDRVREALRSARNGVVIVHIDSPGGNVQAAMQLGRLLRSSRTAIYVGRKLPDATVELPPPYTATKTVPGICYSACAIAFLGGQYRWIDAGSSYGVHRYSSPNGPSAHDLDTAQVLSAALSSYVHEMGVEPGLLDLMAREGKDDMYVLTTEELSRLRVTNNGRKEPEWSVEVTDEGGRYLRGRQETSMGLGKMEFLCARSGLLVVSHSYIGAEKAAAVISGKWLHSLLVDKEMIPVEPSGTVSKDPELVTIFPVSSQQALKLLAASLVGHAMQRSREAPMFLGFTVDVPPSASRKVAGFVRGCAQPGQ